MFIDSGDKASGLRLDEYQFTALLGEETAPMPRFLKLNQQSPDARRLWEKRSV
jgi:hypothetical protein